MSDWAPHLAEFKAWYTANDGFGEYLKHFLAHYWPFFREHQETHAFVYTKLHKEFASNLEAAVNAWLASKGMTEDHLAAMLEYGQELGDQDTMGIVAAMLNLLDYPKWIQYMFSLKQNPNVAQLLEDQETKPGWDSVGGASVEWGTQWWERWTDAEWEQYRATGREWEDWKDTRKEWTDAEWEEWYDNQESWSTAWQDKQESWTGKSWTEPVASQAPAEAPVPADPAYLSVTVPEGVAPGMQLQVTCPDGQLVTADVPLGVGPGDVFTICYTPL
jgi:hypothetical protein